VNIKAGLVNFFDFNYGTYKNKFTENLMFVDPCIIVQFLQRKTQQDATVSKFYYSLF